MPIKTKDHGKCKEWERRRRDRLNDAFKVLAQLLPHYDPAKVQPKMEILEKSAEFVKELRLSNSRLLSNQVETDEKCKLIKELQDEVNRLILRVKQLTILLKKASITIPIGPEIRSLGSKRHKWSGKLKPEDVENAVISNGNSIPGEKSSLLLSPVKANGSEITVENETTPTGSSVASESEANGVKTNSTAINTSVASIIVPLKEANLARTTASSKGNNSKIYTLPNTTATNTSKICQTSPTTTIVTSIMAPSSTQPSPLKLITSEPVFTTATASPLQLPLQTFIITPCSITGTAQAAALPPQNPQILTRITNILPAPILPKSVETMPLQKIPIKCLLKPIPKVIKKRVRKRKNAAPSQMSVKQSECKTTGKSDKEISKKNDKIAPVLSVETDNNAIEDAPLPLSPTTVELQEKQDQTRGNDAKENVKEISAKNQNNANEKLPTDNQLGPVIPLSEDIIVAEVVSNSNSKGDSEKVTNSSSNPKNIVAEAEEPSPENIPVLRIIEAASTDENVASSTENLSAMIVVENSEITTKDNPQDVNDTSGTDKAVPVEPEITEGKEPEDAQDVTIVPSLSNTTADMSLLSECREEEEPKDASRSEINICQPISDVVTVEKPAEVDKVSQPNSENMDTNEQLVVVELEERSDELDSSSSNVLLQKDTTNKVSSSIQVHTTDITKTAAEETHDERAKSTSKGIVSTIPAAGVDDQLSDIDPRIEMVETQTEPPLTPLENLSVTTAPSERSTLTSLDKEKENKGKVVVRTEPTTVGLKDMMDTSESISTTDKISECIARSIDLIDANDSELMELGEHWEDTGTSPKSISPTQIFLNIFPLLPRESSATEPQQQQQPVPTQQPQQHPSSSTSHAPKNSLPFLPSSSNSRSSFFIDAMLPDENSASGSSTAVVNESIELITSSATSHSPFLPLTPPQYTPNIVNQQISNPFSLTNNYYWTPPIVSSANNTDLAATEYRSSFTSNNYSQPENNRVSVNASSVVTTTSSFNTICTTKASTSASLMTPIPTPSTCAPTPSIISNKSSNLDNSQRNSKRSKSTASNSSSSGKLTFTFDTNLPTYTKSKPVATSTTAKTTTPTTTTINVTWALTPTPASALHNPGTSTLLQNTSETTNLHLSATTCSTTSSQVPHHSCSLLDSLNSMDAAFFRPLINALDSHDFRGLDFPVSNTMAPPSAPLPPLIPPPPSKPLFSSQFSTNTQSVQSSASNTSFFDHTTTSSSIQGSFIHHHHHHQPVQMFGSNIQQLAPPENTIPTHVSNKHQTSAQIQQHNPTNNNTLQVSSQKFHTSSDDATKVGSGTDKTSRTSGRQKSESTKKNRSGKSSRTQPYTVPSSGAVESDSFNSKMSHGQRSEQCGSSSISTPTQKPSHSYPFHTIQSHINPSPAKSAVMHSNRTHEFQMENLHSSLHYESTEAQNFQKFNENSSSAVSGNHSNSSHIVERVHATKSELKSHKNKEEKSQQNNATKAAKESKSSRSNFPLSTTSSSSQNLGNSVRGSNNTSLHTQTKHSANSGSTSTTATRTNQQDSITKPTVQNSQPTNVGDGMMQPFQVSHSAVEPFQLFPEFHVGGNSRQFSASSSSSTLNYHENSSQMPLQQPSLDQTSTSTSNFNVQRSHPYYFTDIASSFENFPAVPVHQPQAQPHLLHNSSGKHASSNANSAHLTQGHSQGSQNNSILKFAYTPQSQPLAQVPAQQEFHQFHVPQQQQQQKALRHHHNVFAHHHHHHDTSHTCGQPPSVPQQATPATGTQGANQRHHVHQPSCQSQSQSHHSQSSTATTSTTVTAPASTGKGKQQITSASTSFHVPPTQHHPHITTSQQQQQHHQPVPLQNTHHHQQQNVSQLHHPSRSSSSKTVNWMTDAGYRPSNSVSAASMTTNVKHQQRQSSSTSINNPFSVSKLVGLSTAPSSVSKSQHSSSTAGTTTSANNTRGQQQMQPSSSSQNCGQNTIATAARSNKSARNIGAANSTGNNSQSQNQSSYCAEALIRKNPPSSSVEWTNEFNLIPPTNQSLQGTAYTVGHQHSNPHAHHHHHHHPIVPDHFPNYTNVSSGSYQYPTADSNVSSSAISQFPHFDHSQSQYQTQTIHHHHQNSAQSMPSNNYNTASQGQRQQTLQQHHSSQNQSSSGQINYQHHYPHHSSHHHHQHQQHNHSSTSSVTNFNLSTIFPEINDKRNNNSLAGGGRSTNNGNNASDASSRGSGSGGNNMNSTCNYHHSNFANQSGGSGNLH